MTTDRRGRGPSVAIDAGTLRLTVIAGLAATYLIAWWTFSPDVATDPGVATAPASEAVPTPSTARPGAPRVRAPVVATVRRAPARRPRIRTRSS